jgi:hypothetical protein
LATLTPEQTGLGKKKGFLGVFFFPFWQQEVSPFSLSNWEEQRGDSRYQLLISSGRKLSGH